MELEQAIRLAAAHALQHGGGQITFPPGEYVTTSGEGDDERVEWRSLHPSSGLVVELLDDGNSVIRPGAELRGDDDG